MNEQLSTDSNSKRDQWSDRYGYNPEPDIKLLFVSPENISVNMGVFTDNDWHTIGQLATQTSDIMRDFDFSDFEEYLDELGEVADAEEKNVQQLVTEGVLPVEILSIRQTLLQLSKSYSNEIQYIKPNIPKENDLKDKAIFLLSLEIMTSAIYCVSDEGLTAHMFENNRPPMIDRLSLDLRKLKTLYSQYFMNKTPSLAIEYAEEKYRFLKDGISAQQELLETLSEEESRRNERNQAIKNYHVLASGYEAVINALQT